MKKNVKSESFNCELCGLTYFTNKDLDEHMKSIVHRLTFESRSKEQMMPQPKTGPNVHRKEPQASRDKHPTRDKYPIRKRGENRGLCDSADRNVSGFSADRWNQSGPYMQAPMGGHEQPWQSNWNHPPPGQVWNMRPPLLPTPPGPMIVGAYRNRHPSPFFGDQQQQFPQHPQMRRQHFRYDEDGQLAPVARSWCPPSSEGRQEAGGEAAEYLREDVPNVVTAAKDTKVEQESVRKDKVDLSFKASKMIDDILKGGTGKIEPPKFTSPVSSSSTETSGPPKGKKGASGASRDRGAELLEIAESLCQAGRERRQAGSKGQLRRDVLNPGGRPRSSSSATSRRRTMSGDSTGSGSYSSRSSRTGGGPDVTRGAIPRVNVTEIIPRPSTTLNKDTISKLLNYPKSRRGVGQVEKLLQRAQQKLQTSSRLKLNVLPDHPANLLRPGVEGAVDFAELDPEVQANILNLIDDVMLEMGEETDLIQLSDSGDERPEVVAGVAAGVDTSCEDVTFMGITRKSMPYGDTAEACQFNRTCERVVDDALREVETAFFQPSPQAPDTEHCVPLVQQSDPLPLDVSPESGTTIARASAIEGDFINQILGQIKKEGGSSSRFQDLSALSSNIQQTSGEATVPTADTVSAEGPGSMRSPTQPPVSASPSTLKQERLGSVVVQPVETTAKLSLPTADDVSKAAQQEAPSVDSPSGSMNTRQPSEEYRHDSNMMETLGQSVTENQDNSNAVEMESETSSICSRNSGKRQRMTSSMPEPLVVAPEDGTSTSGEQQTKRAKIDLNVSSQVPGLDHMKEVYQLTLEEEEVRLKLERTEEAITRLTDLLYKTKAQLEQRNLQKQKLQGEEQELRKKRIQLLRGVVNERSSSELSIEDQDRRCGGDVTPLVIQPDLQLNEQTEHDVPQEQQDADTEDTADEPDLTLVDATFPTRKSRKKKRTIKTETTAQRTEVPDSSSAPVAAAPVAEPMEVASVESIEEELEALAVHEVASSCQGDLPVPATPDGEGVPAPSTSADADPPNFQYIGTLGAPGLNNAILQKLAVNFADLRNASYVFMEENEFTSSMSDSDMQNGGPVEVGKSKDSHGKKAIPPKESTGERSAEKDVRSNEASSTLCTEPRASRSKAGKKTATKNSDATNARVFKKPLPVTISANPDSPQKKKKSKKERNSESLLQRCPPASDSESSVCNEKPANVKKYPIRKGKKTVASKYIKEYLHGASSSDCDLEGLGGPSAQDSTKPVTSPLQPDKSGKAPQTCNKTANKPKADKVKKKHAKEKGNKKKEEKEEKENSSGQSSCVDKIQISRPCPGAFPSLDSPVNSLVLGPDVLCIAGDGSRICSRGKDKTDCRSFLAKHGTITDCSVVSRRNRETGLRMTIVFAVSVDGYLYAFEATSGDLLHQVNYSTELLCCVSVPHDQLLCIGGARGLIAIFDPKEMKEKSSFKVGQSAVTAVMAFQRNSRLFFMITCKDETVLSVRDGKTGHFQYSIEGHTKPPTSLLMTKKLVFSGGLDQMVQVHRILTGELQKQLKFKSAVTCLVFHKDRLFIGQEEGVVSVINCRTYRRHAIICSRDHSAVTAIALDTQSKLLYVGSKKGSVEAFQYEVVRKCQFGFCDRFYVEKEHLLWHVMRDHVEPAWAQCLPLEGGGPQSVLIKCQWRNCSFPLVMQDSMEVAENHMKLHLKL